MNESPHAFSFGPFVLERAGFVLHEDGDLVRLPPKPAHVLWVLASNAGRVVSRDEIREAVWPTSVIEFDQSLNTYIRQIRMALGDDARTPRFVQTLPRRGYRFLPTVTETAAGPPKAFRSSPVRAVGVAATLGLLLVAAYVAAGSGGSGPMDGNRSEPVPGRQVLEAHARGEHFLTLGTEEGLERSVPLFRSAVSMTPDFAPSHVGLAHAYFHLERREEAYRHARRAVHLAPGSPSAALALARVQFADSWDFAAAQRSYERALELAPTWYAVRHNLGEFLSAMGRHDEAVWLMDQVVRARPASAESHRARGWVLFRAARFADAEQACGAALDLSLPGRGRGAAECLLWSRLLAGDTAGAAAAAATAVATEGADPDRILGASDVPADLRLAAYHEWSSSGTDPSRGLRVTSWRRATTAMGLGDLDAALAALEDALAERPLGLVNVAVDPRLRPLHGRSRFEAVLRDMGLPARASSSRRGSAAASSS